jgi:glycosyltransferase involved in cell wall biosynthesis
MNLRILFVNRMASMVRGGGETFDIEIARRLQKLGCDVSFLSGIPLFSGALIPLPFERLFEIRTPYTGWFRWENTRGGWRVRMADFQMFEWRAAAWAARRQDDYDVVQVCELPTFVREWKRRRCRPPVVMRLTAPDFYDARGAVKQADAIIASGATLARVQSGLYPDCVNIPNGVDTDLFRPHESSFRTEHGIRPDEFVVLCVARFQSVKNHRMLVEAFAQLLRDHAKSRLVLAGSGPLEGQVRSQCGKLGITERMLFLGEVPYERLPDVYAAADLAVIPSYYESFCFSALEAMASGLPLVTTRTDWVPKLIDGGRGGVVVPIDDSSAMSMALLDLARNPARRREMGAFNVKHVVAEYGWETSVRSLLDVYRRVVNRE